MTIGIGGAGSKIAAKLDSNATLINVSEIELSKVQGGSKRIVAQVRAEHGQFRGSRKNREIGHDAYLAMRREIQELMKGEKIFSSTGGGTGNGITSGILEDLAKMQDVPISEKTFFGIVLPYAKLETSEFVSNTIEFLTGPLNDAMLSGNTGNIVLFSNKRKFEEEISEEAYNDMLVESLKTFLAVPGKNERFKLLDGHIDHEDFALYISKPYFNHFTYFEYDTENDFGKQLDDNLNTLLLPPESPIEALFLLEVPKNGNPTMFYEILKYFVGLKVSPVYSVVENPELKKPAVTVSLLYSRQPAELVEDFNRISKEHVQAKVKKTIEQDVVLPKLEVNLEEEAKIAVKSQGDKNDDVLATLRRLGKL